MKTSGQKEADGKLRYDLIPADALREYVKVLTGGAEKYADRNWEQGVHWSKYFGAAMRHLWDWWRGVDVDPESGSHPLAHAMVNISFLLAYSLRKMKEFDDRVIIIKPQGD